MKHNVLVLHNCYSHFLSISKCHWLSQNYSKSTYLLLASYTSFLFAAPFFHVCMLQCGKYLYHSPKYLMSRNLRLVNLTLHFHGFTEDPITLFVLGEFHYLHKEMEPLEIFMSFDCLFYYGTSVWKCWTDLVMQSFFHKYGIFKGKIPMAHY